MFEGENTSEIFDTETNTMARLLSTALGNNFTSVMISRAEEGYPVIYVNRAFTELTGYTSDEMLGRSPSILQGPKTDLSVIDQLRHDLTNERNFHGETINYRKDGSEFMMEWKIFPISDDHGNTIMFLAIQRMVENGAAN